MQDITFVLSFHVFHVFHWTCYNVATLFKVCYVVADNSLHIYNHISTFQIYRENQNCDMNVYKLHLWHPLGIATECFSQEFIVTHIHHNRYLVVTSHKECWVMGSTVQSCNAIQSVKCIGTLKGTFINHHD